MTQEIKHFTINSHFLQRDVMYSVRMAQQETNLYFYFFDGQNLYSDEEAAYGYSWKLGEVVDELGIDANIVGIYSLGGMDRVAEYQPFPVEHAEQLENFVSDDFQARGEEAGRFIVHELIPEVEGQIGGHERLVGGSSMGGVMALYLGQSYPSVFSRILAMSTAGFFSPTAIAASCASYAKNDEQRVYLDVGTKESEDVGQTMGYLLINRMLHGVLKTRVPVCYVEATDHIHREDAWHSRLPDALTYLLAK